MDIDIGFWLSLAALVTLLVWLADRLWKLSAVSEEAATPSQRYIKDAVEFSNILIPVILVVLVVRSFVFEPFTIPSGSMLPTLQVHDFIVVNKFSYGLRLPVTNTRIIETGEPQRGDIMVFRYPLEPSKNYIKRVVGLPGDTVRVRGQDVFINGKKVERRQISQQTLENKQQRGLLLERTVYVETLDDMEHLIQHEVLVDPYTQSRRARYKSGDWVVPEGNYFVLGDNRENSQDSRFWDFVPEANIVGKASVIWMHWESLLSLPSFSRNGSIDKAEAMQ